MPNDDYTHDRKRSDHLLSDAIRIIKEVYSWDLAVANDYLDQREATDVIGDVNIHIAIRSRSDAAFKKWPYDFTVRSRRIRRDGTFGNETELSKIMRGFGNLLFYGFWDQSRCKHQYFRMIDLSVVRLAITKLGVDVFSIEKANTNAYGYPDGTFFRAFDIRLFQANGFDVVDSCGLCNGKKT